MRAGTAREGPPSQRTGGPGTGGTGPDGELSTIVVGNVGNYSGPAGNSQAPCADAVQAWAQDLNDRGGLSGHQVEVIVQDDTGDPARHQAAVKNLVENRGVIAFVGSCASLTHHAARDYLEEVQVPVIGGEMSVAVWYQSPMWFPSGPEYRTLVLGMLISGREMTRDTKFGAMTCQEAQVCEDVDRWAFDEGLAEEAGLEPVYRARISLTQPDFTAECLSAQNAGVELLNVTGDPNTVARVANSCARQGYHPTFVQHSATVDDHTATAAGGAFEAVLATLTFPWTVDSHPAGAEFHRVMGDYGLSPSAASSMGWAAAKLFERAATNVGEPPDRGRLFEGLYGLGSERLGGLTAPLNFRRGGTAVDPGCWFTLTAANGEWSAPNGMELSCR